MAHFMLLSAVGANVTCVFGEIMLREVCPAVTSTDFNATSWDVEVLNTTHIALGWISRAVLFVLLTEAMLVAISAGKRFFKSWVKISDVVIVAVAIAVEFAHFALSKQGKSGAPLAALWTNSTNLATTNSTNLMQIAETTSAEGALLIFLLVWRIVRMLHGVFNVVRSIRKHSARIVEELNANIVWSSPSQRHLDVAPGEPLAEPLPVEIEMHASTCGAEARALDILTISGDLAPRFEVEPQGRLQVASRPDVDCHVNATTASDVTDVSNCSMEDCKQPPHESGDNAPTSPALFKELRDKVDGSAEERSVLRDLESRLESLTAQCVIMALLFVDIVSVFGEIMLLEVCPKVTSTAFTAAPSDVSKLHDWIELLGWFSRAVMLLLLAHCLLLIMVYGSQFFRKWVMVLDLAIICLAFLLRCEPFYLVTNESRPEPHHADEAGSVLLGLLFWRILRIINGFYAQEEDAAARAVEQVDDALRMLLNRVIEDMHRASLGDMEITHQGLEVGVSNLIRIIDVNGDGTMSREELVSGFGAYRAEISDRAIGSLIRRFDASKTGELNVQEFAKGILEFYEDHRFEFEQAAMAIPWGAKDEAKLVQSPLAIDVEHEHLQSRSLPRYRPGQVSQGKVFPLDKSQSSGTESPTAPSDAPLPEIAQGVILSTASLASFSENGDSEFEAQMLAKASYYHRRHGSGDSNGSDTACTDSAITVPMMADAPVHTPIGRSTPPPPDMAGQWGPECSSWPVFPRLDGAQLA